VRAAATGTGGGGALTVVDSVGVAASAAKRAASATEAAGATSAFAACVSAGKISAVVAAGVSAGAISAVVAAGVSAGAISAVVLAVVTSDAAASGLGSGGGSAGDAAGAAAVSAFTAVSTVGAGTELRDRGGAKKSAKLVRLVSFGEESPVSGSLLDSDPLMALSVLPCVLNGMPDHGASLGYATVGSSATTTTRKVLAAKSIIE